MYTHHTHRQYINDMFIQFPCQKFKLYQLSKLRGILDVECCDAAAHGSPSAVPAHFLIWVIYTNTCVPGIHDIRARRSRHAGPECR